MTGILQDQRLRNPVRLSCTVCDSALPLLAPESQDVAERWECVRCGAAYSARFDNSSPPALHDNVRSLQPPVTRITPVPHAKPAVEKRDIEKAAAEKRNVEKLAECPFHSVGEAREARPARKVANQPASTIPTRMLDAHVERYRDLVVDSPAAKYRERLEPRGTALYGRESVERLSHEHELMARDVEKVFHGLASTSTGDLNVVAAMSRDTLAKMNEDLDLFVALGIHPLDRQYPSRHSLHVAMLAMAMGVSLGYDEATLQTLGLGCLLHDVGMLCLERATHERPGVLRDEEFEEIAKHPVRTFSVLEREMARIPMAARLIAYQLHERCDGSGYPRRREREQIHELARVAMVADVYIALVSPRSFRPALQPHSAVKTILFGVRDGQFDDQVARALLNTVSLFPIGSWVRLSDGRAGQVMRAFGQPLDRPVVSARWPRDPRSKPEIIDLARAPDLRVLGTLSSLQEAAAQDRNR